MRRNEQQLNADIKAGKLARVYMLYGDENFLIRMYTDRLVSLAVSEDEREMNYRKYSLVPNADKNTEEDRPPKVDELADFAESMPFFAEHKCTVLKNFDADMLDEDGLEGYIDLISDLPETSVVIFTRENMGDEPKKFREKLNKVKMKTFIDAVDRNGIVCELNCLPQDKLVGMTVSKCARVGCEMSVDDALLLVDYVGGSMSLLQTEIEKLCAYRGSGEITCEDIIALVPKRIETNIYNLAKELFAGRVGNALEIVNVLFIQRVPPVRILSVLSGHIVDLYRAKLGLKAKKPWSDAAGVFGYKGNRKYVMEKAYNAARPLSEAYLGNCIAVLYKANKLINSTKEDRKRLVIEQAMIEISALPR